MIDSAYQIANHTLLANATLSEFMWALGIVISRAFTFKDPEKHHLALVPFADLLNHEVSFHATWRVHDSDPEPFICHATEQ